MESPPISGVCQNSFIFRELPVPTDPPGLRGGVSPPASGAMAGEGAVSMAGGGRRRGGCRASTASLRTKTTDFRGLDSRRILVTRGGIPRPTGSLPESLSQRILVSRVLAWGLAARDGGASPASFRVFGLESLGPWTLRTPELRTSGGILEVDPRPSLRNAALRT